MQDDFYLNLVDWSSHNVLAVGLGNCVYLWHASSSKVSEFFVSCCTLSVGMLSPGYIDFANVQYIQVVKLCDLGIDDSVSSVGWAQRGTHLAVGTSNGKVQV